MARQVQLGMKTMESEPFIVTIGNLLIYSFVDPEHEGHL